MTGESPNDLRQSLVRLLGAVVQEKDLVPRLDAIKEKLTVESPPTELDEVLQQAVELLSEAWGRVRRERESWVTFQRQLTARCEELVKALQSTEQQTMAAFFDGRKVETAIERQVQDIEARLRTTSSLETARSHIYQWVAIIRTQLEDSQGKGAQILSSLQGQLTKLTRAIGELPQTPSAEKQRGEATDPQALVDPLTSIGSRLAYEQRLELEIARCRRHGSSVVVQLWEIDGFGLLLEKYGPKVGDKTLQLIAKIFQTNLREIDYLARCDGPRFAILLTESDVNNAQWIADRLCRAVTGSPFHYHSTQVSITVSCGYTVLQEGDTPQTLLERAQVALNQATSSYGSGRYCAA